MYEELIKGNFEQIIILKKLRHFRSIFTSRGKNPLKHVLFGYFLMIFAVIYMCAFFVHKYIFFYQRCNILFDRPLSAMYTQNNYRYSTYPSNLVSRSSCISNYLLRCMSRFKSILIIYFRSKKATFCKKSTKLSGINFLSYC